MAYFERDSSSSRTSTISGVSLYPGDTRPPSWHFATLGFVAYAYSYFHADGIDGFSTYPPRELVNIDIRDTAEALEWLRASPYVDGLPIGVWGGSRGAEQAIILFSMTAQLGTLTTGPSVVIASSPSNFVYPGFSQEAAKAISSGGPFPEQLPSAWCISGSPLEMHSPIEVEKINAPLLITYGAEDPVWGPYVDVKKLEQRLLSNGRYPTHFDFSNSEDPNRLMTLISKALSEKRHSPKSIFIRFLDEGHSPRPGTNSSMLLSMATEFFLKTYLHP